MSNTSKTGGAAFPDPGRAQSAKQREKLPNTGMTMLDYFIANAPITYADAAHVCRSTSGKQSLPTAEIIKTLVGLRVEYGYCMMACRNGGDEQLSDVSEKLVAALKDCISVMERELNGLAVIQPELRNARAALAAAGA